MSIINHRGIKKHLKEKTKDIRLSRKGILCLERFIDEILTKCIKVAKINKKKIISSAIVRTQLRILGRL